MSAEIDGIRPSAIDTELYESLTEVKAFRHLVGTDTGST
ncbi:Hypothetical protein NGAL_HAMBI2427_20640 [Neorhizobium galegae bv. orientalis]|uniref:Uncharacterized protein n=1 Tax=Neorhizobium galegae bv. orientalis str. HAMBI 540 TaxID=1028800 RepID=A0A068ST00_NEOGA|nr:Hypothetical protein RG540_CH32430 [Neorhizobium galegae bv. orientalis str. HAMBI 540]CDZ47205.1 Hypothetical protein NGAL_HAMBI2427_20640 [Neorhizobium galegae bv. orientalis]